MENILRRFSAFFLLGVVLVWHSEAQDPDPPRRAARLGYVAGKVSFQPANLPDSTPAELNRPFTSGDSFWSGADGRGELQTENAAMRFSGNTSLTIQELSNQATQITLKSGVLSVRLHTLAPQESFEVDTPHYSFQLRRIGQYRLDIAANGDELMTVRFGLAEGFKADGETESVSQGMQARVTGEKLMQHTAPSIDDFDSWCIQRDQREDAAASAHYVSRDIPGYADLDAYGNWRTVPNYGAVWFPSNLDAEWVPDRFGHFVQAQPWDLHWVEDKPWGFAPFHYGRWKNINGEWGWIPPSSATTGGTETQFAVRPFYAPALVAFAKFAAGTVQPGAVVGWFPLGPGEPWVPGFQTSPEYLLRVNTTNTAVPDPAALQSLNVSKLTYVNRDVAMTALPIAALAAGQIVGRQFIKIPPATYSRALIVASPGVQLTREAQLGPLGHASAPPSQIASRAVVVHRTPAPIPITPANRMQTVSPLHGLTPTATPAGETQEKGGLLGALKRATGKANTSLFGKKKPTNLKETAQPPK